MKDDIRDIGYDMYERAKKAIQKKLTQDPHAYGDLLRPPLAGLYKLKTSHVRVAYHIEADAREVWVLVIGDRDNIWEERQGEILDRFQTEREHARKRRAAQPATPSSVRPLPGRTPRRR